MSFIDKFLDITTPLPREIVRFLKLYKTVEERCKDNDMKLKNDREKYLQKLKEKDIKNNELNTLKDKIDTLYKENLTLSDYKQEILKELSYIFENSFLNKIPPIIEEGQKECQDQIISTNNGPYGTNSFPNLFFNKIINDDLKSISECNDKKKKNDILGKKIIRPKSKKKYPGISSEYSDEVTQSLQDGKKPKNEVYCICKGPCYGEMIECESCKELFHYGCVNMKLGNEPKIWYCEDCLKKIKKSEKTKRKKKIHN
jgi:hypothetical protein